MKSILLIYIQRILIYLKKDFKTPVEKVVVKKRVKVLPDYINEVTIPNIVRDRTKKEEKPVIVPLTKEEKILKQLDNSLTIEDYKILELEVDYGKSCTVSEGSRNILSGNS